MPSNTHNRLITNLDLMPHFTTLPIPKTHPPATIPTANNPPIGTNIHINRIARIIMPSELLFPILSDFLPGIVDFDGIIGALHEDRGFTRVGGGFHHGEHVRFRDEFDRDGDIVFPGAEGFVVGGGDESSVGVCECYGIDGSEMMVVFLDGVFLLSIRG